MNQLYIKITILCFFLLSGIIFSQTKTKGVIIYPNTGPTIIGEKGDTISNPSTGVWDFDNDTLKNVIIPAIENLSQGGRIYLVSKNFLSETPYFNSIQAAIDSAGSTTDTTQIVIIVFPGRYDGFELNKSNISILGYPGVFITTNKNSGYAIKLSGGRANYKNIGVFNLNILSSYNSSTPNNTFSVVKITDWSGTLSNINIHYNYLFTSGNCAFKLIDVSPTDIDNTYKGLYIENSVFFADTIKTSSESSSNSLYGIYVSATQYQSVFINNCKLQIGFKTTTITAPSPTLSISGIYSKSTKNNLYANWIKNTEIHVFKAGDYDSSTIYSVEKDATDNLFLREIITNTSFESGIRSNNTLVDTNFVIFK